MSDNSVHHTAPADISEDRGQGSEESDASDRYRFAAYELELISASLINGLEALLEVERVHDLARIAPSVFDDANSRGLIPLHPTGTNCAGEFCQALRTVHRALFACMDKGY